MTVTKKHIANVQCLLLTLRHALKQSCHWSIAWSMKLCWLLTTFQSDAASAHWHPSLVSDKHVPACRFQSVFPGASALVSFSCSHGVKVNGAYYCDVLLLKQLLSDICQAAGDFCFLVHHACARALSCCVTIRLRTSHQTRPPNKPDLSSVNYRLLGVIQECVYQKKTGDVKVVKHHWWTVVINRMTFLLTQWHIIFHKVGLKHPSGQVGNYVAVLLQIYYSICVLKISKYNAVWQSYSKNKRVQFFLPLYNVRYIIFVGADNPLLDALKPHSNGPLYSNRPWQTGRWRVGCYIWYSEEGLGELRLVPSSLYEM